MGQPAKSVETNFANPPPHLTQTRRMKQFLKHRLDDPNVWICLCGNRTGTQGFSPCYSDGTPAPTSGDSLNLFYCRRCHRIINGNTREILAPQSRPLEPRILAAVEQAEHAFWAEIVKHFPEAQSGDFNPLAAHRLTNSLHEAVNTWIDSNCFHLRYAIGQYVLFTTTTPISASNAVGVVERDGVRYLDPDQLHLHPDPQIAPVCPWANIETLHPWNSPSDAQLEATIRAGQGLPREQRLILQHRATSRDDAAAHTLIELHQEYCGEF